jgi:hypothetical protein
MRVSIVDLFSSTFRLIRKDKILLAPSLMAYVFIYLLLRSVPVSIKDLNDVHSVLPLLFIPLVHLVFFALTVGMADMLYRQRTIVIPEVFKRAAMRFHHLFLATILAFLPLGAAFYLLGLLPSGASLSLLSKAVVLLAGAAVLLVLLLTLFVAEFVPIMVLVEDQRWLKPLVNSARFVKRNIMNVIVLMCVAVNIRLLAALFSAIFLGVPVLGKSFFFIFFNGVADAIFYVMIVIFYFRITQGSPKIDVVS